MARALWNRFAQLRPRSIPVEIHTAVRDKGPRFRMLRKKDKSPIHFQRVAERDGEVVEWEQIVKGYEFSKGHFIVLTPEDFEKAALKKDRIIDIIDFVSAEAIDDRFFDKPYYVLPAKGVTRLMPSCERRSSNLGRLAWRSSSSAASRASRPSRRLRMRWCSPSCGSRMN